MTTTYLHHDTEVRIIEELGDGCVVVESVNGSKPFMNQDSKVPYWFHCDWVIAKVADLVEIVDDDLEADAAEWLAMTQELRHG